MKRFYTVKEAAKILGFSTNTVYKYLDEGKIKGRRIGQGRFRIPHSELEPFGGLEKELGKIISSAKDTRISNIIKNAPRVLNDFIFFRVFLSLSLTGIGLILLLMHGDIFRFGLSRIVAGPFLAGVLIPLLFILAGIGTFFISFTFLKVTKIHAVIHVLVTSFLLVNTYILVASGKYGLVVFSLATAALLIMQEVRGYETCCNDSSFYKEFVIFTFFATGLGGILTLILPNFFPILVVAPLIAGHRTIFALIWLIFVVTPSLLLISERLTGVVRLDRFLIFFGFLAIVFATTLSIEGRFADSYWLYLYGIFSVFLLVWLEKGATINRNLLKFLTVGFAWSALVIILVLFAGLFFQENLKKTTALRMQTKLSEIVLEINSSFDRAEGNALSSIQRNGLSQAILSGDKESAISAAEEIFSKVPNLRRVLILDASGNSLGVYPRNLILETTNLSEREHFQITKRTLRPFVGNVLASVLNTNIVSQTIPVFTDHALAGMVFLAYHLENSTRVYQSPGSGGEVFAYDSKNIYSLNPDFTKINSAVPENIVKEAKAGTDIYKDGEILRIYEYATKPRWTVYIQREVKPLLYQYNSIGIVLSLLIIANSAISLAFAFGFSKRSK